jgi:hypothetical protein
MPAGKDRPLQAANREFLGQSANFWQIPYPAYYSASGVALVVMHDACAFSLDHILTQVFVVQ